MQGAGCKSGAGCGRAECARCGARCGSASVRVPVYAGPHSGTSGTSSTSALQHSGTFGTSALRHSGTPAPQLAVPCASMRPPGVALPYADIDTVFLDVGNTLVSIDFAWVAAELGARGVADRYRVAPARRSGRAPGLLASVVRRRRAGGHRSVSRVPGGVDRAAARLRPGCRHTPSTRSSPSCDRSSGPTAGPACCGAA